MICLGLFIKLFTINIEKFFTVKIKQDQLLHSCYKIAIIIKINGTKII